MMTNLQFFTHDDFAIIPKDVGIIFKNYGAIASDNLTETKSCFSWSVIEMDDVYAGTYFVSHQLPVTKEFLEDVIGVLCGQIKDYLTKIKMKGGDNGQTN